MTFFCFGVNYFSRTDCGKLGTPQITPPLPLVILLL
jgi:hypothetical protein